MEQENLFGEPIKDLICELPGCLKILRGRQEKYCCSQHGIRHWLQTRVARGHQKYLPLFEVFHEKNPDVLIELERDCYHYIVDLEYKYYGIRAPWERIRWERVNILGTSKGMNDRFTYFYVALILMNHPEWESVIEQRRTNDPDLAGFIEVRERKT